ncbi:MAG: cyclic pyranopterin monophosphate synthase MoaC [Dehalococcoidales bacterium]|nr:cyclic pyranopterin monophosphate synthase MoaC [Dehalococcoidales bacterium]
MKSILVPLTLFSTIMAGFVLSHVGERKIRVLARNSSILLLLLTNREVSKMAKRLSHVTAGGEAHMVDISKKNPTVREAIAKGKVLMKPATILQVKNASLKKGDVLAVARVAGIMAAKKVPDIIPLCHTILIDSVAIDFDLSVKDSIGITATARSTGKTGVEMEALTAVTVAALTIYDMCKAADKGMTITDIYLESKTGGKSGIYRRKKV